MICKYKIFSIEDGSLEPIRDADGKTCDEYDGEYATEDDAITVLHRLVDELHYPLTVLKVYSASF